MTKTSWLRRWAAPRRCLYLLLWTVVATKSLPVGLPVGLATSGAWLPSLAAQGLAGLPAVRQIGLALPGILFQYNGSPSNALSSLTPPHSQSETPFALEDVRAALAEWKVFNRLDLLRQLNQLMDGGSNEHYQYLRQIYQQYQAAFQAIPDNAQRQINSLYRIDSPQLRSTIGEIWSVYHDLSYTDVRRLIFLWKMERWFAVRPVSIQGWDQARIVALVRWGYDLSLLSEQEAWPYIERAGSWVVDHFASWNRYVENYIYGRLFEYAGSVQAAQIFRDSALIWWELIVPPQRANIQSSQQVPGKIPRQDLSGLPATGTWQKIRLQAYSDPQDSFFLHLYRDLFYFQQAIRAANATGVQSILDQSGVVISPQLAQRQPTIEIDGHQVLQQPLDQPSARGVAPVSLAALHSEQIMNTLVSRGFRYQVQDREGRTPLHWAAKGGTVAAVGLALQLGLNPNQPDNLGVTPIHLAARYNSSLVLYRLLQDPRSQQLYPDSRGFTPLHEACYNQVDSNAFGILLQERYSQLTIDARAGSEQLTPLMIAASLGKPEQIVSLLQRGADPNARDQRGWTGLHYAAQSGAPAAIRLLLSDGGNVNARSKQQETPLLIAVRDADSRVVALLLQAGADPSYANLQLKRPIHLAGLNPDVNVLQLLLQNGADAQAVGPNGQMPLHFAAELGSLPHLRVLLEAGAAVDSNSRFGFTPLMIAVSDRNYEAANFLINNGAQIDHTVSANTPLPQDKAELSAALQGQERNPRTAEARKIGDIQRPRLPSMEELAQVQPSLEISYGSQGQSAIDYFGWSPITLAARQGDYQMVWSLVEAGADFQNSQVRGWYAVHFAAAVGSTEVLSYLISRGADIAKETPGGQSAIELAATDLQNGAEKLRVLLRASADTTHIDKAGWSAMTYAALLGNREFVRLLLNQELDPNAAEVLFPPLVAAAYAGQQEIVFLLLQRGADPNLTYREQGTTALHYAVALNRPELWGNAAARSIPAQLLGAGALVSIADKDGNTPLFWAARWGNATLVKMLLERNASTFAENAQQLTPFYYALENRYGPARYLIDSFPLAKLNQLDSAGMTPLIRAARFGTRRIVALLLAAGAKAQRLDKDGYNALFYALFASDPGNISTLLRGGLKAQQKFSVKVDGVRTRLSPLLYAVRQHAPLDNIATLVDWLQEADINEVDSKQKNALHYALEYPLNSADQDNSPYALVELLLRKGADPNIANRQQDTPLIMAIRQQDAQMLRILLEAGADVRKPGKNFQTPLQVASSLSAAELVALLRSYGAGSEYNFRKQLLPGSRQANPQTNSQASPQTSPQASGTGNRSAPVPGRESPNLPQQEG